MRKGSIRLSIVIIASLIFLLIVLGIVYYRYAPYFRYGMFSPCWASTVSKINALSTDIKIINKPQVIEVGDCLIEIAFLRKEELFDFEEHVWKDFSKFVNCDVEKESFIIAVPRFGEKREWSWNPFTDVAVAIGKTKDLIEKTWKEKLGGIKPLCVSLSKPIRHPANLDERILRSKSGETVKYCVELKVTDDNKYYDVVIRHLREGEKCEEKSL
ncbi:MAG: hypothetical protein DRP15_03050 [Candidatus Aenigmatarchaeota archaeon]|nr:MAG: hypothetical protein DRP15_03050 [Candidatus Aenigmarchaeota archaeon]